MRYRDEFEDCYLDDCKDCYLNECKDCCQNEERECEMERCEKPKPPTPGIQTHDHEFLGSTKLAEEGDDRHNHRFASVTSEVIPLPGGGHRHSFFVNTDFFENHHHEVAGDTGPAIPIPGSKGKHVHFATGRTTMNDGHFHEFQFTTLIDDPLHPL